MITDGVYSSSSNNFSKKVLLSMPRTCGKRKFFHCACSSSHAPALLIAHAPALHCACSSSPLGMLQLSCSSSTHCACSSSHAPALLIAHAPAHPSALFQCEYFHIVTVQVVNIHSPFNTNNNMKTLFK